MPAIAREGGLKTFVPRRSNGWRVRPARVALSAAAGQKPPSQPESNGHSGEVKTFRNELGRPSQQQPAPAEPPQQRRGPAHQPLRRPARRCQPLRLCQPGRLQLSTLPFGIVSKCSGSEGSLRSVQGWARHGCAHPALLQARWSARAWMACCRQEALGWRGWTGSPTYVRLLGAARITTPALPSSGATSCSDALQYY